MFFVLLRPIFCEKWKIAPPIRKEPPREFWRRTFFFFGDHLILGGKNVWILDFGRKIPLNFGEDLFFFFFFFFGDQLLLGGKNRWISDHSETFRLKFQTNPLKLIQGQWKFESRSFAHFSLFQNSPPPFPNPGYAPESQHCYNLPLSAAYRSILKRKAILISCIAITPREWRQVNRFPIH